MKSLIAFVMMFSATAFAAECYQHQQVPRVTEVSMPSEFCVTDISLKLEPFGTSEALLSYTFDGVAKTKVISLNRPIQTPRGKVVFLVWDLYKEYWGGHCGDTYESDISATLEMNKDGTEVKLIDIKGSIGFSNDNCHSGMQEVQGFPFSKI